MARHADEPKTYDLRSLELGPGIARDFHSPVTLGELVIGDEKYHTDPAELDTQVEVSQSLSGWHFRLRLDAALVGPCWRCLEDARLDLKVDSRDFAAFGRNARDGYDEDLDCEYLDGESLDIVSMTRDALIDLVPPRILCRDDCSGLCPNCGKNLNDGPCGCAPAPADSRWSGLAELAERLKESG